MQCQLNRTVLPNNLSLSPGSCQESKVSLNVTVEPYIEQCIVQIKQTTLRPKSATVTWHISPPHSQVCQKSTACQYTHWVMKCTGSSWSLALHYLCIFPSSMAAALLVMLHIQQSSWSIYYMCPHTPSFMEHSLDMPSLEHVTQESNWLQLQLLG